MEPATRVYAVGGSILAPDDPSARYAAALTSFLAERIALGERALVVTGGGGPARRYIRAARAASLPERELDVLGITCTRANAQFLAFAVRAKLGPNVCTEIPVTVSAAAAASLRYGVVFMGGTTPGHSTDYVAASLATAVGADHLYVLTNVDGVYTADPRSDPAAKRLDELDSARLLEIVGPDAWSAGSKGVLDPKAAHHVHEHRLPVTVLDGRSVDDLRAVVAGKRGIGSRVVPA